MKNKCCLYVIITILFFSITICNLLINLPSYDAIYATLRDTELPEAKYLTLQALGAKIVRLHHAPLQRLHLDTDEEDRGIGETPNLHHAPRQQKRQDKRRVNGIYDMEGNL